MTDKTGSSASDAELTDAQQASGEPLTEAQRTFAKVLGRLLAERWLEEQRGIQAKDSEVKLSTTARMQRQRRR
jgi:hypothetical protein